ncbi:MAG TPA: DNA polymerase III subunit delta [Pelolinea sp.]|nr:DNA polymerase III subunit delta [Pelolinea sp.]
MPVREKKKEKEEIPSADVYVLQGDDELSIGEIIGELAGRFASVGFAEMNFVRLDGRGLPKSDLANHVNMLPMGGANRLIVIDAALDFIRGREKAAWLESLVAGMPASTVLALVVNDSRKYSQGKMIWQAVGSNHSLKKALKNANRPIAWLEKPLPSFREMPEWIANEASAQGVEIEGRAATELASLVGNNLFQARNEITKAASYAGEGQEITRDMIRLLCSPSREEDIFALVDAAGQRNPAKALGLLNSLMRDQPIQYIFSMVVRQIRLLIIAKEIIQEGGDDKKIATEVGTHPFVARKLMDQAPRFSMRELETIYQRLDCMDEESKTGNATPEVMLEILIADLSK